MSSYLARSLLLYHSVPTHFLFFSFWITQISDSHARGILGLSRLLSVCDALSVMWVQLEWKALFLIRTLLNYPVMQSPSLSRNFTQIPFTQLKLSLSHTNFTQLPCDAIPVALSPFRRREITFLEKKRGHILYERTYFIRENIFYMREHTLYERKHSTWEKTFYMREDLLDKRRHSILENTFHRREHISRSYTLPRDSRVCVCVCTCMYMFVCVCVYVFLGQPTNAALCQHILQLSKLHSSTWFSNIECVLVSKTCSLI